MAYEQNQNTLIARFEDYSTARQAALALEDAGVPSGSIQVDSNRRTAGAGSSGYSNQEEHHTGFRAWWDSLFGSDDGADERKAYESALESGASIVRATVPASQVDAAVDVLNRSGAMKVENSPAGARTGYERGEDRRANRETNGPLEVVEEELEVGKRAVQRGGVRVYSHVVTEPAEQQIRLREEHVKVERRKVDREISPDEVSALRDQTIEVQEMAEEPVVAKRARVREEVVVGKESTERTENIRENLRRSEVEVEQLPGTGNPPTFPTDMGDGMTPAYGYGYRYANDERYRGRSFDEVENDLRRDYERSNPSSKWEEVKSDVRRGWDKVTGRA